MSNYAQLKLVIFSSNIYQGNPISGDTNFLSGFSYNFEMYSGQENNDANRYSWEPDFGASGNVVVRLCRIIPKNMNYNVYFDNYYTSVPLIYEKP